MGEEKLKVFISGSTGVLGRRVVARLLQAGYRVVGLSRSQDNDQQLKAAGVTPRRANLFQPASVSQSSFDCQLFLHLATAIPKKARTSLKDWKTNDRIRRQGTDSMLAAATAASAEFFLTHSLLALHGNRRGEWVDCASPINPKPDGVMQSAVDLEQKAARVQVDGLPTCILRFGMFYSADSAQTQGMIAGLKSGDFPIIGSGENYWIMIHADDVASAAVSAVQRRQDIAGSTLDLADDQPVLMKELINSLAEMVAGPKPKSTPVWLSRLLLGAHVVDYLLSSIRCRNEAARRALQLTLNYPTYLDGFNAIVSGT